MKGLQMSRLIFRTLLPTGAEVLSRSSAIRLGRKFGKKAVRIG